MAHTIHKQAPWMVSLLNEVLDLARMASRKSADVDISSVLLSDRLPEAIRASGEASQNHRLRIDLPGDLPPIAADRAKAVQPRGQVLNNAINCSPKAATSMSDAG